METVAHNIVCRTCETVVTVRVYPADLEKRERGVFVQIAFPYLARESREMFVSQICDICWNHRIFSSQNLNYARLDALTREVASGRYNPGVGERVLHKDIFIQAKDNSEH